MSNIHQPKVSIIIPVYNTEKYLQQCLDSIVNQTLRDIEIICVNDGSTDGSFSVLKDYQARDPRITVISQENRGQSAARNSGLDAAQGQYIYFLDSDDYVETNLLERTVHLAEEMALDVIAFGAEVVVEESETTVHGFRYATAATEVCSGVEYIRNAKENRFYNSVVWLRLWRSSFLFGSSLRFKEGIIHEDNLFSFQAFMKAERICQIPDKLYHRRVRPGSIMTVPKSATNVIGYFTCAKEMLAYALCEPREAEKAHEACGEFKQMVNETKRVYKAIPEEERAKVVFAEELQTELFQKIVVSDYDLSRTKDDLKRTQDDLKRTQDDLKRTQDDLKRTQDDLKRTRDDLKQSQYALDCVHNSVSFCIGRAVTWLPRKIRGGVRCCQEHGVSYTVKRTIEHLTGKAK